MPSFELTIKYPISFWLTLVSMDTHSWPTIRRKMTNILEILKIKGGGVTSPPIQEPTQYCLIRTKYTSATQEIRDLGALGGTWVKDLSIRVKDSPSILVYKCSRSSVSGTGAETNFLFIIIILQRKLWFFLCSTSFKHTSPAIQLDFVSFGR